MGMKLDVIIKRQELAAFAAALSWGYGGNSLPNTLPEIRAVEWDAVELRVSLEWPEPEPKELAFVDKLASAFVDELHRRGATVSMTYRTGPLVRGNDAS